MCLVQMETHEDRGDMEFRIATPHRTALRAARLRDDQLLVDRRRGGAAPLLHAIASERATACLGRRESPSLVSGPARLSWAIIYCYYYKLNRRFQFYIARTGRYEVHMAATSTKRERKRHIQQELFRRGGKRRGAGRKPKGDRAGAPHKGRPAIKPQYALHIVMRVVAAVGNMRRRAMYKAMRDASIFAAVRARFRIVHISIQRNHVHMLVEANTKLALARGMQGFQISAARNINTVLGVDKFRRRRGPVFADRYHLEVITSPTRARHALSYVLNNWRRHREDQEGPASTWLVDPFSSGISFPDWKELDGHDVMWPIRAAYDPLLVRRPQSWLLREGWKRVGPISARDVPRKQR
jgi:REP element-mobilizing transposase RayT